MLSHPRSALMLTVALAAAALLHSASADTSSALDLPTTMTNDEAGFAMSYPPSWGVTTYTGANQIDFNDGLTFVIVDAIELDALPTSDPAALLQLLVDDLQAFLSDLEMTDLPGQVVGGLDAIGIRYTGTDEDLDVRGTVLVMADERYAYLINFEAAAAEYASYEATFHAMLASFQRGLTE